MVNLSFIISTRNRLPFLKITLERLIGELQRDEEIIVIDGASTDGTKKYLQALFEQGKIPQYVSEPDRNQAHGWNKAMLMAKGTIIKKIIDDDVFCYSAIRKCKEYMLKNPGVDVVISNDLSSSLTSHKNIHKNSRLPEFEKWKNGSVPSFTFGDVHMLIKKSSLSYIGLYNTAYVMMDWEYSLRISYLQANIAYFTGYNALSVAHPQSVTSLKDQKLINKQGERGNIFYEYKGDGADISLWSRIKIFIGKKIYGRASRNTSLAEMAGIDMLGIYNYWYQQLAELNDMTEQEFISKLDK